MTNGTDRNSQPIRIGIDIGGTFTDFLLINDQTGDFAVFKALTTPHDPSEAVLNGVGQPLDLAPAEPGPIG